MRRLVLLLAASLFFPSCFLKKKGDKDATSQPVSGPVSQPASEPTEEPVVEDPSAPLGPGGEAPSANTQPVASLPTTPEPPKEKPPEPEAPKIKEKDRKAAQKLTEEGFAALANFQEQKAISFFEDALKKDPTNADAAWGLGELQRRRGELDLADLAYRTALKPSGNPLRFLTGYTQLLVQRGQGEQAIRLMIEEVRNAPDSADLLALLAGVEVSAGKLVDAQDHARQALKKDEKHIGARVSLARAYLALNKDEIGYSIVKSATEIDPRSAPAHFYKGVAEMRLGKEDDALISFQKAAELDPNFPEALTNYGARLIAAGSYAAAVTVLERASALLPRDAVTAMNLGSAYRGVKNFGQAEALYQKAIRLNPNLADAYFNLGVLYLEEPVPSFADNKLGRLEATITQFNLYKKAVKTKLPKEDPTDAYLELAQKQLEIERKRAQAKKQEAPAQLQTPETTTPAPSGPKGPGSGGTSPSGPKEEPPQEGPSGPKGPGGS